MSEKYDPQGDEGKLDKVEVLGFVDGNLSIDWIREWRSGNQSALPKVAFVTALSSQEENST